jgi:hypothetical protein
MLSIILYVPLPIVYISLQSVKITKIAAVVYRLKRIQIEELSQLKLEILVGTTF